ncbi:MAG: HAD hydrolase-like protein [Cellulomonadaceae bacterium]|jgi:phosphoglycolate phosphatase-like HAD superfamily hydrolase|nr:HAD hydrolase-like protein [Cellulomonadaceae bacterium]
MTSSLNSAIPWRYFIWDLGGTLLDNYENSTQAFVETLAEYGSTEPHDSVYAALRVSTDHAIETFAPDVPGFLERYRELESPHLVEPILFAGALEVLSAIVTAGGANYLVSHRDNQVLDILRIAGIAQYFAEVVTKDSGFARKPDPAAFDYLIDKYHLDRALTVTIGDRPIDVDAGQAAHIATIYFDPQPAPLNATCTIKSLTDLLA